MMLLTAYVEYERFSHGIDTEPGHYGCGCV